VTSRRLETGEATEALGGRFGLGFRARALKIAFMFLKRRRKAGVEEWRNDDGKPKLCIRYN
jgi:hypothetical protein